MRALCVKKLEETDVTLVILGHNHEKSFSWGDEDAEMVPNGLFAASDSTITSNGTTLLGGFRKVYSVPVKIWKPYFVRQNFHSYREVYYESECFIAIAGSTLTAQHVLNCISEHLGKLRISYERASTGEKSGKYVVIRHCQKNILHENCTLWGEDTFTQNDYKNIEDADSVSKTIEYSINEALSSARKYKLSESALNSMYTEFAAGIYCPISKKHKLYTYKMDKRINEDGVYEVFVVKNEIDHHKISVLGMRDAFQERAQQVFDDAIQSGKDPSKEIFKFLNDAIDEVSDSGSTAIDRPSVLRLFDRGSLSKEEFLA
jgi:hypothetical protein